MPRLFEKPPTSWFQVVAVPAFVLAFLSTLGLLAVRLAILEFPPLAIAYAALGLTSLSAAVLTWPRMLDRAEALGLSYNTGRIGVGLCVVHGVGHLAMAVACAIALGV